MLKIFIGIVLLCFSFGGYLQFLVPLAGAVIIISQLVQMRKMDAVFNTSIVSAVTFAAYEVLSAILYMLPIYETANFSSYLYAGKIILGSALLIALYSAFKNRYGRRTFGIIGLILMNVGSAAVVMLAPVFQFGYDEVTVAMAVLVYAFVLGYIGTDMRMIHLSEA